MRAIEKAARVRMMQHRARTPDDYMTLEQAEPKAREIVLAFLDGVDVEAKLLPLLHARWRELKWEEPEVWDKETIRELTATLLSALRAQA